MKVDWQTYYDAAAKCRGLADELRRADKPLHQAIKGECAGMAGDAPGCREWGGAYDRAARRTLQANASLANALTNYGAVLYAMGYHYGTANKSNPPQPDVSQVGDYTVSLPTSVADNGLGFTEHGGLKQFFDELVAKVLSSFGKLPNGDSAKLAKAHAAWDAFARHDAVTNAPRRIAEISALFDTMDEGANRQLIQDHFATLKFGAESVGTAGTTIAAPISDYQAATIDLGAKTTSEINKLELSIAVTALVGGALALFSLGTSAAGAAAAISADVALTVNAIQASYRTTQMVRVIGLASLAAGAIGAVDAFHAVPEVDLDRAIAGLAALVAIKVFADDDGAFTVATKYEDLNPAPEVPLGGLTDASETYVRGKHVEGGASVTPKKSVFDGGEDLDELVERAQDTEARGPNDYGNYERDVDAGREIGTTSRDAGARPTTRYKVITDRWGTVVNMYPI